MNDNQHKSEEQQDNTPQKSAKIKLSAVQWGVLIVVVLVGAFIWYGMQPLVGTVHIGICRTFAELQLRYPSTMKITDAYVFEKSQRITYTYIDPFGHRQSSRIDCRFKYPIGSRNKEIESIAINRQQVSSDEVALFNASIPAIVASNPDNTIPFPPGNSLMSLKTD